MADGEVEVEEPQPGHRKDRERRKGIRRKRSLYVYWDEAHECCTNRDNKGVVDCQIDKQMSEKYGITRDYHKSNWKILRSQLLSPGTKNKLFPDFFGTKFIVMRMWDSLFSNQCLPKIASLQQDNRSN